MTKNLGITLTLLILLPALAIAEIKVTETDDLNDVRKRAQELASQYGAHRLLVAFDLDNTLLAMKTELGADQWYEWQKELQEEDPCSDDVVSSRLAVQGALFHLGSMRPTQDDAAWVVSTLQTSGIATMVLTARGQDVRLPTFRELRRNGFDFEVRQPFVPNQYHGTFQFAEDNRLLRFEDGVFMLAGQHKGHMLIDLLKAGGNDLPKVILFADDKKKNVDQVEEALKAAGIDGELFRYSREDARVAAFNEEKAAAGWAAIDDAVEVIQEVMGVDNSDVPEKETPAQCQL